MKKTILLALVILFARSATFSQAKQDSAKKHPQHSVAAKKYTCTMHPEIVMDKPGKCPKCGMALVPMDKKAKSKKKMDGMKK